MAARPRGTVTIRWQYAASASRSSAEGGRSTKLASVNRCREPRIRIWWKARSWSPRSSG